MANEVNRAPHNTIPQEWAFHPTIGPFVRELINIVWQLRNRTGGDTDMVGAIEVQSDDILLCAMEARIAELERTIEGMQRDTQISKPDPFIDIEQPNTLVYSLLSRIEAIEAQL